MQQIYRVDFISSPSLRSQETVPNPESTEANPSLAAATFRRHRYEGSTESSKQQAAHVGGADQIPSWIPGTGILRLHEAGQGTAAGSRLVLLSTFRRWWFFFVFVFVFAEPRHQRSGFEGVGNCCTRSRRRVAIVPTQGAAFHASEIEYGWSCHSWGPCGRFFGVELIRIITSLFDV